MMRVASKWRCGKRDTKWAVSAYARGGTGLAAQGPWGPRARPIPPHGLRCAPNRLLDQPKPTQANRVWVSDITYLPLADGNWAYRCAFQDMASKRVVGWQVGATMPE